MNILVFSDSHGRPDNMTEALSRQIKKPDAVIFLGDGLKDFMYLEPHDIPIFSVSGNCDGSLFEAFEPTVESRTVLLGGKRIFITHGHRYFVKHGLSELIRAAVDADADIALFGHTHQCLDRVIDAEELSEGRDRPLYLMNPGSIGYYPNSWGNVEIDREGRILLSHGALL